MRSRATLAVLASVFVMVIGFQNSMAQPNAKKSSPTGDAKAGEKKAQLCILCHRPGNVMAAVPLLEAQPAKYLYDQMKAYKDKRRADATMQTNVANVTDRDMRDIAQYFSLQPPKRETHKVDAQKAATGKAKADEANCAACHNQKGKDQNVPHITGLPPSYIVSQLEAFTSGKRNHGSGPVAAPPIKLSAEDAEGIAHHFAQAE